ncbi:hypothetical protein K438DRAFT_1986833 [Mycena galopus ATCC 62051]|nr:hypothetical protein K438DRAFT_1986833 [Mycena galopus ATCC 62051]
MARPIPERRLPTPPATRTSACRPMSESESRPPPPPPAAPAPRPSTQHPTAHSKISRDRPSDLPPASAHDLKPALVQCGEVCKRASTSFKARRVAFDTGAYDGRQRRSRSRDVESVGEGGESVRETEFESDAGSTTTASTSTLSVLRVYVDRRAYPHPVVRATDAPAPAPAATVRVVQAPAAAQNDLHACSPRLHTRSSASQSSSSSPISGPHAPVSASAPSTLAIMQRKGDGVAPSKPRELDSKYRAHTPRPRPRPTRDLPRQERTPVAPSARALDTRADYALPPCPTRLAHRTLLPPSYPPTQARAAQLLPSLSTRSPTPCSPARLSRTDAPRAHRSTQHVCVFLHPRPRRRHYVESLGRALRSAPIYPLRLLRLVAAAAPYTRAPRHAPR